MVVSAVALGGEVIRFFQRHMAFGTIELSLIGVVKCACIDTGNTREKKGVVVILASEELLIFIDGFRDADLVTDRAEFCGFVERFKECLFMKLRFSFDQLFIDKEG